MMDLQSLTLYPVLLAGGSGTRLWPISRAASPKQLARLIGKTSLIQNTALRLLPVMDADHLRIVCGDSHAQEMAADMAAVGITPPEMIINEPCGRNTAPAILLAILKILEREADAVIFIFPADHVIGDEPAFHERIRAAVELALDDRIVTFGITPEYPETGYGYIEASDVPAGEGFCIARFVEKPDLPTAEGYLEAGNFYWNSGMFAFKASVMKAEFARLKPGLLTAMEAMLARSKGAVPLDAYQTLESISIDYAVMEQTDKGVVLPSAFGWSDIGSWKSLYDFVPPDDAGNVILYGDVLLRETRNCLVMGQERLIALNRLENLAVVETPDAVFVSDLEQSRDAKHFVEILKESNRREYRSHTRKNQAWGYVKTLEQAGGRRIRRIVLLPGREMAEWPNDGADRHWMVVAGWAEVRVDGRKRELGEGETVRIPRGSRYGAANRGEADLHLLEVTADPEAPPPS
jgi:mannose-1-phosphate guanylyltransferase/mannose-1-phosphate guanylyltransferase/mannose-6-phosphate isomerase